MGGVGLTAPYPECIIRVGEKGAVTTVNSNHQPSLGRAYVPGVVLCNLHVLFYFILTATLSGENHYYLHFIDETFRLKCRHLFENTASVWCQRHNQDSNTGPLDP